MQTDAFLAGVITVSNTREGCWWQSANSLRLGSSPKHRQGNNTKYYSGNTGHVEPLQHGAKRKNSHKVKKKKKNTSQITE